MLVEEQSESFSSKIVPLILLHSEASRLLCSFSFTSQMKLFVCKVTQTASIVWSIAPDDKHFSRVVHRPSCHRNRTSEKKTFNHSDFCFCDFWVSSFHCDDLLKFQRRCRFCQQREFSVIVVAFGGHFLDVHLYLLTPEDPPVMFGMDSWKCEICSRHS